MTAGLESAAKSAAGDEIAAAPARFGIGFANLSGVFTRNDKITHPAATLLPAALFFLLSHGIAGAQNTPQGPPPPPEQPTMTDTLSKVPDLPNFYDADTSWLLGRYAEKLVSDGMDSKNFAIQELAKGGEEAALEIIRVLERYVGEPSRFGTIANCAQALALTKTRNTKATDLLAKALDIPSGTAQAEAVKTIGVLGHPQALGILKKAFNNQDPAVRRLVVIAIGKIGSAESDATLADIVRSETTAVGYRQTALDNLCARPIEAVEKYLREFTKLPSPLCDVALLGLTPTRDPEILKKVRAVATSPTNVLCGAASLLLAKVNDYSGAIFNLRAADATVRKLAGLSSIREAIRTSKPEGEVRSQVVDALRARTSDPDRDVRVEAIRLMIQLGETPDLSNDLKNLQSDDPRALSDGIEILTDIEVADRRATRTLMQKLEAAPFSLKMGFAQALGRLRDPEAATTLEKFMNGETAKTGGIFFYEYCAIQCSNLGKAGLDAVLRAFEREKDPIRRAGLARGLTYFAEPRAELRNAFRKIGGNTSEHPEVRAVLLRFIPIIEKSEGAAFLKRLLESEPDPQIRRLLNWLLFTYY